ncbi:MAG: hypothetical protein ACO1OB_19940 [Archangium sp.]
MISALLLVALHAAPLPENTVGTVVFQGSGRAAEFSSALLRAVPEEIANTGFAATNADEQQRAAAMCGEDTECLATIGRRLGVGWIIGLGVGAVGKQTLVTGVLVDVNTGKPQQRFEAQRPTTGLDAKQLAKELVTALFASMTPKVALTPAPIVEVAPQPPPEIVQPPVVEKSHPARGAAIGFTVGAVATGLAGGGLSIAAATNYPTLQNAPDRRAADDTQRALNVSADVTVGVAIAAGVTAIVLFIVDGASK